MWVAMSTSQRHAQGVDQIEDHLAAGRRGRIEPVQLAVAGIPRVMVDVDDEEPIEPRDAGARQVAALHDDRGVVVSAHGIRDLDARHGRETAAADPAPDPC